MFSVFGKLTFYLNILMIITNFNIINIWPIKRKTYAPLIVYGNGMLPLPIFFKRMKPIAGWHSQIIQFCRRIYFIKFPKCPSLYRRRKFTRFSR